MGGPRSADDTMLTIPDLCARLRSGRTKVKKILASGDLPSFQLVDGPTSPKFVWESELVAYLKRREEAALAARRVSPRRRRKTTKPAAPAA